MHISLDCIPCIINSFRRLLKTGMLPEKAHEASMRQLLTFLANVDYHQSPPALGRIMHRMIRAELQNPDPYREIKAKHNRMMLEMYLDFKEMVNMASDPFDMAMRLAIAGNVIDFGPQYQLDVMETIERVVHAELAIDDSLKLKNDLQTAKTVMYIGDNCGEIVLDKLFMEEIKHRNLYFVVRGGPTINDATIADAQYVGIDKLAKIITTGDDAPGAVWETSSDEFKQIFQKADVIISKGQGNLEGLLEVNQNIYFLLITKCPLISKHIGVPEHSFVVFRKIF